MPDWTSGYVADIGYNYSCFTSLNPLLVKIAFLNAGLVSPEMGTACELGFGQGLSVNMHAAASVTQWYGTDFIPAQADFAQELAAVSGSGARLYDEDFADFARRTDLPDFDYIGLHGTWSWISDENRAVIVDFIRRKLKVGGVLYISYNILPGWAAFAPIRHLMTEHARIMGAAGHGIIHRIDSALSFADKVLDTSPTFTNSYPQVPERLKKMQEQKRAYLAHEFFNRDWHPMYFSTLAEWLEPTKLSYACSAHYRDHIDAINLNAEQQALLNDIPDTMFRESVRDFITNRQFRSDFWVKGARNLNPVDQTEALRRQRVLLKTCRAGIPYTVEGHLGEMNMNEAVYRPILDKLADYQVQTIGQIEQAVKQNGISFAPLLEAVIALIGTGHLAAAQDEATIAKARVQTDKINQYVLDKARGSDAITHLASPVIGGGINIPRPQQLFLLAKQQGMTQPAQWADYVWQLFNEQERGRPEDAEKNRAMLLGQATAFADKHIPILDALQVIPKITPTGVTE